MVAAVSNTASSAGQFERVANQGQATKKCLNSLGNFVGGVTKAAVVAAIALSVIHFADIGGFKALTGPEQNPLLAAPAFDPEAAQYAQDHRLVREVRDEANSPESPDIIHLGNPQYTSSVDEANPKSLIETVSKTISELFQRIFA